METMGGSLMVDSNIWIYAFLEACPFHNAATNRLEEVFRNHHCFISRQILREVYASVSQDPLFQSEAALSRLHKYLHDITIRFKCVDETPQTTQCLLRLAENYQVKGKQIHDANIVASMQSAGITKLLTHNVQDFQRYADVVELMPLEA